MKKQVFMAILLLVPVLFIAMVPNSGLASEPEQLSCERGSSAGLLAQADPQPLLLAKCSESAGRACQEQANACYKFCAGMSSDKAAGCRQNCLNTYYNCKNA
jgi:hypothetical protein